MTLAPVPPSPMSAGWGGVRWALQMALPAHRKRRTGRWALIGLAVFATASPVAAGLERRHHEPHLIEFSSFLAWEVNRQTPFAQSSNLRVAAMDHARHGVAVVRDWRLVQTSPA